MFDQLREIREILKLAGIPGYLLIFYFIIQIVFARQKSDMAAVDLSAVIFAAYAMGCGVYSWKILHRGYGRYFFLTCMKRTPLIFFVLYTILCLVSSLWSPNLTLSAYRAVECFGLMFLNMATVMKLFENCDERLILKWSAVYGFMLVVLQFGKGALISLDFGLYTVQFPSTIFFYMAFYFAPNKLVRISVMLAAFLCKSVTGYIGIAVGMISLLFGTKKYRLLGFVLAIIIVSAISYYGTDRVLNTTIFASKHGAMVNGQLDENKTSGRTKIWEDAQRQIEIENREWYGVGFVVGEMQFARSLIGNQVIGMHNGFLSAYVGTGRIGFFLFVLFMLGMCMLPMKKILPSQYKAVLIASMCVILIHTFGNPGLGFRVYGTWMPAMYIVMLICGFYIRYKYGIMPHIRLS